MSDHEQRGERPESAPFDAHRVLERMPAIAYRSRLDARWSKERISAGCLAVTGYRPADLLSDRVSIGDLMHPDDRLPHRRRVLAAVEAGEPFEGVFRLTTADGKVKWLWDQGDAIYDDDGQAIAIEGLIIDVSREQRLESTLRTRASVLELAARNVRLTTLLETLISDAQDLFPNSYCSIALWRPSRQRFDHLVAPTLPEGYRVRYADIALGPEDSPLHKVVADGERLIAADISDHLDWWAVGERLTESSLSACWLEPVKTADDDIAAVFGVHSKDGFIPDGDDIMMVEDLSHLAGIAIEHHRTRVEQRKHRLLLEELVQQKTADNEALTRRLADLAKIDDLTGIANRRGFDEHMSREWRRRQRSHSPLALVLVDIDDFRSFNDEHGHTEGDRCLRHVARTVARLARRPGDLAARFATEEFVLVLPRTGLEGAEKVAEAIRMAVRRSSYGWTEGEETPTVTVSTGVAVAEADEQVRPAELVERAEAALVASR